MSLINTGRGLQRSTIQGFGTAAKLEAEREAEFEAMKMADRAQKASTAGSFGGTGASYGVKSALDAAATTKDAVGALNTSLQGTGTVGVQGGGLTYTPVGAETALTGAEATAAINEAALAADAAATAAGTSAGAGAGTAATTAAGTSAGASTAATATTATQAATATSAAAASSPLATLATVAAPLAIGVGLAFLLNELF